MEVNISHSMQQGLSRDAAEAAFADMLEILARINIVHVARFARVTCLMLVSF